MVMMAAVMLRSATVLRLLLVLLVAFLVFVLHFAASKSARKRSDDTVTAGLVSKEMTTNSTCYGAHNAALAFSTGCGVGCAVLRVLRVWVVGV